MSFVDDEPPDNTGSETLNRFRYQAEVAMQYCIECAAAGRVESVYVEHFEDILVEFDDYWCFMQVKSKVPSEGKWTLNRAQDGLQSLFRAFKEVDDGGDHRFRLLLEGGITSAKDMIKKLTPSSDEKLSSEHIEDISNRLDCSFKNCKKFVKRLTIVPNQTPRQNITSHNIKILADHSSNTSYEEVESAYQRTVDKLVRAMAEDHIGGEPFSEINSNKDLGNRTPEVKHITKEKLKEELGFLLNGPYPLLERVTDIDSEQPSDLEKKLLAGGAREKLVMDAKTHRANATHRTFEVQNLGEFSEEHIEDVEVRVQSLVNSIVGKHIDKKNPANYAWAESVERISKEVEKLDPNMVYNRDPMSLLGVACELTDKCKIDWGEEIE